MYACAHVRSTLRRNLAQELIVLHWHTNYIILFSTHLYKGESEYLKAVYFLAALEACCKNAIDLYLNSIKL